MDLDRRPRKRNVSHGYELEKFSLSNDIGNRSTAINIASKQNLPPSRFLAGFWQDKKGMMWVFGGLYQRNPYVHWNDIWRFNPLDFTWEWMAGSSAPNPVTTWGDVGVASPSVGPGIITFLRIF